MRKVRARRYVRARENLLDPGPADRVDR